MSSKVYIPTLSITVESPYITKEKFAEKLGLSSGVVDGWVERGYIHSRKIGTRRVVNLAAEVVVAAYKSDVVDKVMFQVPDTGFSSFREV